MLMCINATPLSGSDSDVGSEELVGLWYITVSDIINPFVIKSKSQLICNAIEEEVNVEVPEVPKVPEITVQSSSVSVFNHMTVATMAKEQAKDPVMGLVQQYVLKGPIYCQDWVESGLQVLHPFQFERFEMKQGALHHLYISNNMKSYWFSIQFTI